MVHSDLEEKMEIILTNAKLASWLRSFSEIEPPKRKPRKVFEWMENEIIPFWMFSDIVESIKDVEDDDYFDEYNVDHHSGYDSYQRMINIMRIIFILVHLYACILICWYKRIHHDEYHELNALKYKNPKCDPPYRMIHPKYGIVDWYACPFFKH